MRNATAAMVSATMAMRNSRTLMASMADTPSGRSSVARTLAPGAAVGQHGHGWTSMTRQHVEIIDGKKYMATTLPRTGGSLPHRLGGLGELASPVASGTVRPELARSV
jgi:hypothetical protein